jgi:hypothetical protein
MYGLVWKILLLIKSWRSCLVWRSLTTQLAMQLQQAMLTRQQTTTPNMVNANIPPAYGNLNHPFNNYMGYPNSLQQNFPFQPAHVGYPAHNQQQNSPYQTGPPAFKYEPLLVYLVLVDRSSRGKTWSYIVCCCWILQIRVVSILMVWIQHRSRLCGGLIEI